MVDRLFVYGTLAPGRPNEHILAEFAGSWEEGTVRGVLQPQGWGAAMGYPGIVLTDENAEAVKGYIFTSAALADHWSELDAFEGDAYKRVLVSVRLKDDCTVEAYIYALRLN